MIALDFRKRLGGRPAAGKGNPGALARRHFHFQWYFWYSVVVEATCPGLNQSVLNLLHLLRLRLATDGSCGSIAIELLRLLLVLRTTFLLPLLSLLPLKFLRFHYSHWAPAIPGG